MFLPIFSIAALGILLVLLSLRYLIFRSWFKAWVQGTLAIAGLILAIALLFASWDLYRYQVQGASAKIANITTYQLNPQHFNLVLELNDNIPLHFEVKGDLWQLDVRLLIWGKFWQFLGLENAFRLDRLSGRYHTLDDERTKERTLFDLWQTEIGGDQGVPVLKGFKQWVSSYKWLPGASLIYGSGTYVPMKDRAQFAVYLEGGGLQVRATNDVAREAITLWQ